MVEFEAMISHRCVGEVCDTCDGYNIGWAEGRSKLEAELLSWNGSHDDEGYVCNCIPFIVAGHMVEVPTHPRR